MRACAALALGLALPPGLLAQGGDPAALSQMLDQLSEAELAALLLRVKRQNAAGGTSSVRRPPAPAAPRATFQGRPSSTERLAKLRLEVAVRDTSAAILQSLGPAGEEPRVARIVGDLVSHAYQRTGPFAHSPRRGMTLSSGEAKLLAGKILFEVEDAMGGGAPFTLSPQARQVFEAQILAAAPGQPATLQAQVRAQTQARLAPQPAPIPPLAPEEIEAIDAAFFAALVREKNIDNHSSRVLKQWAEEEARRRRRELVALGPAPARAWLRRNR